jgi:hypothetical protein
MHPAPNRTTAAEPAYQQLRLPLDPSAARGLAKSSGAETEMSLAPAAIWGLPPPLRAQVRQTFLRVGEELLHADHGR